MASNEFINRRGSIWERTDFAGKSFPELRGEMEARILSELKEYPDVRWEPPL